MIFGTSSSRKSRRKSSRTLTSSSTHSPIRSIPERSTRTFTREVNGDSVVVPAGSDVLQTYFRVLGGMPHPAKTTETPRALSFVTLLSSLPPGGNAMARHANRSQGVRRGSTDTSYPIW